VPASFRSFISDLSKDIITHEIILVLPFVRDLENVRKNPIFTNLQKTFEHIELPAMLLDYFVRSIKSNINQ